MSKGFRPGGGGTALFSGYSQSPECGHRALAFLADRVGEEFLGEVRVVARLERAGAGDVDQGARVFVAEVVELGRDLVLAFLGRRLVPVVVVDDPGRDLAVADRGDDALVVVVALGVVGEAFEPGLRGLFAVELLDRADDRDEVGLRRGDRQLALPLRLGEVEDRGRQFVGGDQVGVVDHDGLARGDSDPVPGRRAVPRGDFVEGRGIDLGEQFVAGEQFQRRRVLGEEDVGGGGVSLLLDLAGETLVLAVADLHLGAVLLFEAFDQSFGHRFVLGAVEGQRAPRAGRAAPHPAAAKLAKMPRKRAPSRRRSIRELTKPPRD